MRLEQQVCSLELAKRLKELGVKQESIFFWERDREMKFSVVSKEDLELDQKRNNFQLPGDLYCSAFTVAELGEIMNERFRTFRMKQDWYYNRHGEHGARVYGPFSTEADARATCIIKRLESIETYNALSPKV